MRRIGRRIVILSLLLVFLAAGSVSAIELEDVLQALLDEALSINIIVRVTENGQEEVLSYELTRVTISGRAVRIRLEGGNVTIVVEFTPYEEDNGSILLVAEGQLWLESGASQEIKYRTSLRSMPVEIGESVLFYPLGVSSLDQQDHELDRFNIELEIRVQPYEGEQG
jgi:hypothetical protein